MLALGLALVAMVGCSKPTGPATAGVVQGANPTINKDNPAALPTAASPTAAAAPTAPVTLTLWHSYRDDERKALDELVAAWNAKHPLLTVTALAVPFDALIDKVQVAIPNGNGPDLLVFAHDKIGTWARDGLIAPLGDFANKDRLQRFLGQTVKPLVYERAIYGLPLAFKSMVLFYNKKMIKDPPSTLAQLVEVAKGFTDPKNEAYGLAYDAADLYAHAAFLHAYGGKVWNEDTRKLEVNTPQAIQAIETVKKLYTEAKILPKGVTGFMVTAMFNDGKTPFVFSGPWFVSEISKDIQWGVAVLPTVEEGKPMLPYLGSEAVLLSAKTAHKEEALQVLDYLTSDEAALTRLEHGHQMVANVKVYENARLLQDPVVKVFRAQADRSVPMPNAVEPGVAWTPYSTALRKAIFGEAKAADALAEADKQIQEALAKLGK